MSASHATIFTRYRNHSFSKILDWYGNGEVFKRQLNEGCRTAASGRSIWTRGHRIAHIWVFYKPNGEIATYQHPQDDGPLGLTHHGNPFEKTYSGEDAFEEYQQRQHIVLEGDRHDLAILLESLERAGRH